MSAPKISNIYFKTAKKNIQKWEQTPLTNHGFLCSPLGGSTVKAAHSAAHRDPETLL